jgi:hypothetical protein
MDLGQEERLEMMMYPLDKLIRRTLMKEWIRSCE